MFYLILFLFIFVRLQPVSEDEMNNAWSGFLTKYGKMYSSPHEEDVRFGIFKENYYRAQMMTHRSKGRTQYGVTKFSDLSEEEFRHNYLMTQRNCSNLNGRERVKRMKWGECKKYWNLTSDSPKSLQWDWRDHGAVTYVKDQGQCGSCWTFSATGCMEGAYFLATGKLYSLSEQQILDCCGGRCQGCNGGYYEDAFSNIITYGGIETNNAYTYRAYQQIMCYAQPAYYVARFSDQKALPREADQIATVLEQEGPISVSLDASPLQYYEGGIVDSSECSPRDVDHAVLLVGYGSAHGTDFWLVKNSWSEDWGLDGYFKIEKVWN